MATVLGNADNARVEVVSSDGKGDRLLAKGAVLISPTTGEPTVPGSNISTKFRESFSTWPNSSWMSTTASGDIIAIDGNAAGSSYLVISKSPFTQSTETRICSVDDFLMPVEMAFGIHMSQRTVGQVFSVEAVSTEADATTPAALTIATIQQATTTLTVTTATEHNLRPGMRIAIYGTLDSRLDYPAVVVATTPTPTSFTVTAGPAGNLPSLTVGPLAGGQVVRQVPLNNNANGTALVFENATATQASIYSKSDGFAAMPVGGTVTGNHSVTVASTASVQAINAALTYAFRPTSEYRLAMLADRLQWQDNSVDAVAQATARATVSQVIPNPGKSYRLRVRATNTPSLTVPVAKVVSAAKTGTTTATVVTATAHGLKNGDIINLFGARDQTNFPNVTGTATAITVVDATTFTVVWGGAVTATTFGGYAARVNGGQALQGAITQAAQSVTVASGILTLVGSAAWSGLLIGDYVDLFGCEDNVSGADLGVDGAYRVRDIQTTSLVLEPIGSTVIPTTVALTNCGGGVIKRTDLRISFARVFDYERLRVEALSRPSGDVAGALPVSVQGTPAVAQSGTWTVGLSAAQTLGTLTTLTGGGAAEDAAAGTNPVTVGGVVRTAATPTTLVAGDAIRFTFAGTGAAVVKPYAVPEAGWNANLSLTTTTAAALAAAGGAGLKRHITAVQAINTGASAVDLIILDGATERWRLTLPVNVPVSIAFPTELVATANTALNANLSAAGTVRVNAQGYTAP